MTTHQPTPTVISRTTRLKCGHSLFSLDLISWTCCICGEHEPGPPKGVKNKQQRKHKDPQ
jgi:hypothetical protein